MPNYSAIADHFSLSDLGNRLASTDLNQLDYNDQVATFQSDIAKKTAEKQQAQNQMAQQQKMQALGQQLQKVNDPTQRYQMIADYLLQNGDVQGALSYSKEAATEKQKSADTAEKNLKQKSETIQSVGEAVTGADADTYATMLPQWQQQLQAAGISNFKLPDQYGPQVAKIGKAMMGTKGALDLQKEKAGIDKDQAGAEADRARIQVEESEAAKNRAETKRLQSGLSATGDTGTGGAAPDPALLASQGARIAAGEPSSQVVPGYGKGGVKARQAANSEAVRQIMEENPNMTPAQAGQELANRTIDYAAGKKSTGQLTTMLGATRQAVSQLDFNVDKTSEEMAKLGSSNISPVVNAIARGEEKWTGDPAYSGLFFYMHAAATESARILSGGQASVAQLHQGAMEEAQKWANVNMTPASWKEVSQSMKDEGKARLKTYQDAIDKGRIAPGAKPSGTAAASFDPDTQALIDKYKTKP